ncbi:MAG: Hsp20/alpha crystallin family protein [Deltaproteobacteria bacterium]|nr:Hsp20/alpha crystallin family protein [Deltaproteobacteria bacterium]
MNVSLYRRNALPSLFRDVFGEDPFGWLQSEEGQPCFVPQVDIREAESSLVFELDLPGVNKESLKVEFNDGVLSISGERKLVELKGRYFARERCSGRFARSFRIGDAYDPRKISAAFKDGMLSVEIQKKEESKPITVDIH